MYTYVYDQMHIYVVVILLSQLSFIFPLFLGMIMNANEFETKKKYKNSLK